MVVFIVYCRFVCIDFSEKVKFGSNFDAQNPSNLQTWFGGRFFIKKNLFYGSLFPVFANKALILHRITRDHVKCVIVVRFYNK